MLDNDPEQSSCDQTVELHKFDIESGSSDEEYKVNLQTETYKELSVKDLKSEIRLNKVSLTDRLTDYFNNRADEVKKDDERTEQLKHIDSIIKDYLSLKQVNMSLLKNVGTDVERMLKIDLSNEEMNDSDIEDIKIDMDFIDADRIRKV